MDSIGPVDNSREKVQVSQPSLTKRGLKLQEKSENPSPEAEKVTTPETDIPPQTPPENSIDMTV